MRILLTVQQYSEGSELLGEPGGWSDVRQEWFEVQPLSSAERLNAQQMQSEVTHNLRCRWFAGAASTLRIVRPEPSRVFNVQSVINVGERNRELLWSCVEVA